MENEIGVFYWTFLASEYRIVVTTHKYTIEVKTTDALGNEIWRVHDMNTGADEQMLTLFIALMKEGRLDNL